MNSTNSKRLILKTSSSLSKTFITRRGLASLSRNNYRFSSAVTTINNNNGKCYHSNRNVNNSKVSSSTSSELSEKKYITVNTPQDVLENSKVTIEWLKKEGDEVEDNELVCRIDRQPLVGDEIREIHVDYKGKIHKIPFKPAPTSAQIGQKLEVIMSPNKELFILETTEAEIRSQEGVLPKVKRFIKKYGILGVVLYFAVYFITLGSLFLVFQQGLFATKDVLQWLHNNGLDKYIDLNDLKKSEKYANLGVAWVLTKFTEPLRLAITVAITPSVYKLMRKFVRK